MAALAKPLVYLAGLAFLAAVVVSFTGGSVMNLPAESFSRACTNLALIAIGLVLVDGGKGASMS